jgi:hypothetical protein
MTATSFTCADYAALLDAIGAGGYAYEKFETDDGRPGVVLLRHDIDKSVALALRMARMEAERGVRANYFFLLRSRLYSLLEPESILAVREIASLGHSVGLHCDAGRLPGPPPADLDTLDGRILAELRLFEEVLGLASGKAVTFHNPPHGLVQREPSLPGYLSGYAPRFMLPRTKYISDSNAHWREGDPRPSLAAAVWPRVQILVHPLWWMHDAPRPALAVLRQVLDERGKEMDAYLRKSNALWEKQGA